MAVYRRSARPRFTLLLLILTSLTIITLDYRGEAGFLNGVRSGARDLLAPVQDVADRALSPLSDVVQGIVNRGDLEAENARLREQLAEARGEVQRAADAERERKALLDIQGLDFVGDIPSVAARVVSTTSSNFQLAVVIDRGSSNGVVKGLPVVAGAGLVGRVADVSRQRAVVVLIPDLTSHVCVRLTGSGEVGVASGRGARAPLAVGRIAANVPVARGEVVVTSGLQNSVFPPGLPVGRVLEARARRGDLEQKITLQPAVDFERLSFVRVLQWDPARGVPADAPPEAQETTTTTTTAPQP